MSRAEARGDQFGGKLETRLDTNFDGEIVGVLKLVVADDGHEGAEHLEGTIEIQTRLNRVRQARLGVPAKLEGTAAVVAQNIKWSCIVIIHIQLLPDRTDATAYERAKLHLPRPAKNGVDLHRYLYQFPIS